MKNHHHLKNQTSIVFTWLVFWGSKNVSFFLLGDGFFGTNQLDPSLGGFFVNLPYLERMAFAQSLFVRATGVKDGWFGRSTGCSGCQSAAWLWRQILLEKCLAQLIHPLKWLIREWIWMGVYLDAYFITCLCPSPRNRFFALGSNLIAISGSLTSISKDYQTSCWSNQISMWFKLCIKFRKGCVYVSTSEACNTWLWAVL